MAAVIMPSTCSRRSPQLSDAPDFRTPIARPKISPTQLLKIAPGGTLTPSPDRRAIPRDVVAGDDAMVVFELRGLKISSVKKCIHDLGVELDRDHDATVLLPLAIEASADLAAALKKLKAAFDA